MSEAENISEPAQDRPTARILLFTGDGKGKTTAALGLALRAVGHEMPVCIVQFIKSDRNVGEARAMKQLAKVEFIQSGLGFLPIPSAPVWLRHKAAAEEGLRKAQERLTDGACSMLILDEVCVAVERGLLTEQAVADVIAKAPPESVVVLTGRGATPGLIALADTVSEMRCVKHGFRLGRSAQKGVEM